MTVKNEAIAKMLRIKLCKRFAQRIVKSELSSINSAELFVCNGGRGVG